MNLFFNQNIVFETSSFNFSQDESRHIFKVLRKTSGDKISVTNGKGLEWLGILTKVENKNVTAERISAKIIRDTSFKLEIAISPTKSNERIEWFLEKIIEIGIKKIHFIKTENSERKKINITRLYKIAISAMKQSKQFYLPEINDIISYKDFIKTTNIEQKFIAHCKNTSKKHIANISLDFKPLIILIGPEGDFSKNEIELALSMGYSPISLGNQRLRTETAAMCATQTISTLFHLKKNKL